MVWVVACHSAHHFCRQPRTKQNRNVLRIAAAYRRLVFKALNLRPGVPYAGDQWQKTNKQVCRVPSSRAMEALANRGRAWYANEHGRVANGGV